MRANGTMRWSKDERATDAEKRQDGCAPSGFSSKAPVSQRRTAFTLIELLVVIAIIGILVALMFPALKGAMNKAKCAVAFGEVKSLETAWKKYYQEYTGWPSNTAAYGVPDPQRMAMKMNSKVIRMLQGALDSSDPDKNNNKQICFIEFSHTNTSGDAISPWPNKDSLNKTQFYYVKFDTDFDNVIPAGGGGSSDNPDSQPATSVRASVVVWTYNPSVDKTKPGYVIGSWLK